MNRFIELTHQYFNGELEYLSVTKLIGQYQRPFNSSMVSHMVAKKTGQKQSDILNTWDLKRDIAIDYGNSVHKAVELWVKYQIKPTQPHLLKMIERFIERFGDMEWQSEVRLFNEEYQLGGTVDLMTDTIIADVKTNDTLKVDKKGNFIKPLNKVKVNNLNKVRLQTKIYETMTGKEMIKMVLHWDGEDFNVIELEDIDVSEILAIRKASLL